MFGVRLVASIDYFRANFPWYDGATQGMNAVNAGLTITWLAARHGARRQLFVPVADN